MPRALITGIAGQDGAYLSELLIAKGYEVHGILRRSSSSNTARIDHLNVTLHHGDTTDGSGLVRLIHEIKPTEIYNLAAQSDVKISFDTPEYTANADGLGVLRLLETIRTLDPSIRFYQASTSELYGEASETPQRETTPFQPRSPYAVAKLFGYWSTVNYREAYGLHASNGILFNHESPLRGENFVTRKITKAVAAIEKGQQDYLIIGNLNAKRDWGHARDYVEAMWLMLQQDTPDDYVIATGEACSVRKFIERAFAVIGRTIVWTGNGEYETGFDRTGAPRIIVDKALFRPCEVPALIGNAAKAKQRLGWSPKTSFDDLVTEMVMSDLN